MIRIDTNYIIRYLVNDNIEMANKAEEVLLTKDVFIANEILAEVIYVLEGVYKVSREESSLLLEELLEFENILVEDKEKIKEALKLYRVKRLDFVDCLLCLYSQEDEIITFDKKLNKCIQELSKPK
jgi:predicted nucleic-acid-binding protein